MLGLMMASKKSPVYTLRTDGQCCIYCIKPFVINLGFGSISNKTELTSLSLLTKSKVFILCTVASFTVFQTQNYIVNMHVE